MKNYSLIHQKRLGNIFKMKINLDEEVMLTKIPPLTLQLLTENALKHNVIAKGKPLTVTIKNTNKWIIVENNVRLKRKLKSQLVLG
jgi:Putative regulator of cell autolysis